MDCNRLDQMTASGVPLTPEAELHVRQCPRCSQLYGALAVVDPVPDALTERVLRTLVPQLKPVKPLRASWFYVLLLMAVTGALIFARVWRKGHSGFDEMTPPQAFAVLGVIAGSGTALALELERTMTPGRSTRLRPHIAAACTATLLAAAYWGFFPFEADPDFLHRARECFLMGLPSVLLATALILWILCQGAVLERRKAGLLAGSLGSISGIGFLEAYCVLEDAGHKTAGHLTLLVFSTLVSALAARYILRSRIE